MDPSLELYGPWLKEVYRRHDLHQEAFSNVDDNDVSLNLIFLVLAASHRARTYSRIPARAMQAFINLVTPALEVMVGALNSDKHDLFTQALQSFLIIPQFALVKSPKETAIDLENKLFEFREGPKGEQAAPKGPEEDQEERKQNPPEQIPPGLETLPPRVKKALARFKFFAGEGRFSKASQSLTQAVQGKDGALEPTKEVIAQLRQLHPQVSQPPEDPPHGIPNLPFNKKKFKMAANRIANGSAADLLGWTGELQRL